MAGFCLFLLILLVPSYSFSDSFDIDDCFFDEQLNSSIATNGVTTEYNDCLKRQKVPRGEYETKEEYAKRTSRISCDSLKLVQVYKVIPLKLKYNPDTELFVLTLEKSFNKPRYIYRGMKNEFWPSESTWKGNYKYVERECNNSIYKKGITRSFRLSESTTKISDYVDSLLGNSLTISYRYSCQISNDSRFVNFKYSSANLSKGNIKFEVKLKAGIDKARRLKSIEDHLFWRISGEIETDGYSQNFYLKSITIVDKLNSKEIAEFAVGG